MKGKLSTRGAFKIVAWSDGHRSKRSQPTAHNNKRRATILNGFSITALIVLQLIAHFGIAQNSQLKFNLVLGNNEKPLGKVNAIAQDPHGYMWFAGSGERCIYQYDGNRVISFRHADNNPNSLGLNIIETIYADDEGIIWIGGDGLDEYNPATGIFKHYRNEKNDTGSLSGNYISTIAKDAKGRLWVGMANGLDRLDEKTGKFTHYRHEAGNEKSLSSNFIWRLYKDRQGALWVGTGDPWFKKDPQDGGLNRLNNDGTFTRYMHDPKNPHSLINNKIAAMYEDSRGTFWVGTSGDGLHTMDRKTGSFERHLYNPSTPEQLSSPPLNPVEENDKISFINSDSTGAIWIGTMYSGINRYDYGTKKITHYKGSNGFPDSTSWSAFTSRDGELWITTERANLYRADPIPKSITAINAGSSANCFAEDKEGFLWAGTDKNGLQKYNQQKKLVQQFNPDSSHGFSLFNNPVSDLLQSGQDTIWIGSEDGIGIFNKRTEQFSRFPLGFTFKDRDGSTTWTIFEDKQGQKWFATGEGAVRYNPLDGSIMRFQVNNKDTGSISSNRIISFLEDRSGVFWVGVLNGGINRFNKKTNTFSHYLKEFNGINIYEDSEGTIWAGTSRGLYRYNKKDDRFSPFLDAILEISNDFIYSIIEDNTKNLWITTPSAIVKINTAKNELFIYGSNYGIPPGSIVPNAMYKTRTGQILIGYEKGFYAFYPEELAVNAHLKIILTNFFINSLPVMPGKGSPIQKPVEEISNADLQYNQNSIAFGFAAIDYREPETARYFTMLENYDNVWREVKGEKSASYFNLPQGNYVFRIKVFNSDGTKAEKAITIVINPPWWRTWWAYCVYALLLLAAIYAGYRYQKQRIIHLERQKRQQFELAQAKEIEKAYTELKSTQALLIQSEKMASLGELTAGVAHEIQNPLNFVNNFAEINKELIDELREEQKKETRDLENENDILNNIEDNLEKINHHGKRADAIVKGMLQHSRTSTGIKESTDINKLADEYLRLAYHGLRAKDKSFNATMKTDFDESIGKINIVPQDIGRVILNLITNAFYAASPPTPPTGGGISDSDKSYSPTIWVSTKKQGDKVLISVRDNGQGIPQKIVDKIFQPFFTTKPTGQGTGLGLSLSYDIVKAHGGEIKVETKEGEGSTFYIELPV